MFSSMRSCGVPMIGIVSRRAALDRQIRQFQEIECSPYKNTAPMMKLLAESHRFLKIEHEDAYKKTIKQIEYMEKHKLS